MVMVCSRLVGDVPARQAVLAQTEAPELGRVGHPDALAVIDDRQPQPALRFPGVCGRGDGEQRR
jgi:hypothetical protein